MSEDANKNRLDETVIQTIQRDKPQTVDRLVSLVKEKQPISEQLILESILKLQSKGKIRFTKTPLLTPPNLTAYLKTEQAHWYWVTMALAVATAAVALTIPDNFYPWIYVRHVLGTIFVLWLPGYTFTKALYPTNPVTGDSEKGLDMVELIAFSIGMSLALVPIVGLLLNYTPWGIRLTPIILSLLSLTVFFATVAIIREQKALKRDKQRLSED